MTDKEQIIIDTNQCKYKDKYINYCLAERDAIGESYTICTGTDCYFKQLARKMRECKKWKHQAELGSETTDRLARQLEEKTQECESYRKALEEIEKICEEGLYAGINYEILNIISKADFGKSERSETCPSESCVEPVESPIIQEAKGERNEE